MSHEQVTYSGRIAAPGLALGLAHRIDRPRTTALPRRGLGAPEQRIDEAFNHVAEQLNALSTALRERGQPEQAEIMAVGALIAQDADLREAARERTRKGTAVQIAVREAVTQYARMIADLDDPTLAQRSADVRQVGKRVLERLDGVDAPGAGEPQGPLVLIAEEVGAIDLLQADRPVVAALSVAGGPNSHAAIVARSLSIPLLIGIEPELLDLNDGVELLVSADGSAGTGTISTHPPAVAREAALAEMANIRHRRAALAAERELPCQTLDHKPVILRANVATAQEAQAALSAGADGAGLVRTELPFLEARRWPSQAGHTAVLIPILREFKGRTVTVRTLDFADDKLPPFLTEGRDGTDGGRRIGRGLPLMLAEPSAFGDQFRAVLSACPADAELRVMIPMVATLAELRSCRGLLNDAAADLGVAPPPLGVMIELPEAVALADELAAEAAFISIGSNDLTSQILGLDRRDPAATPRMAAHPRVLAAIDQIVTAAHRYDRPVSVCGDAAADPIVLPLLLGLNCDILSVAPAALDTVRYGVRRLHHPSCRTLVTQAMALDHAEQVWELVQGG